VDYKTISIARDGHLAVVTVTREEVLNALNEQVMRELTDAARALDADDAVRVVCLTGAGNKAFVAGADIAAMQNLSPREARAFSEIGGALGDAIEGSPKVFVAAVNGFALGGGTELALCCDFIYATTTARFGQPEVKLGVIPGFGGTQRLSRRVGIGKARELVFSGQIISAEEALRIGLADAVVPPEDLMPRVRDVAGSIAGNAPLAVAEAKRVMQLGQSMTLDQALVLEQRAFGELFATDDQKEGMAAFLDKRAPAFKGR
jgi:enoyl-CoA hydratase